MQPFILQAKTQTINGLSKKIKLLKNKKGTDEQKEKNKRKAESLVSEIMLIKVIIVFFDHIKSLFFSYIFHTFSGNETQRFR